MPNGVQVTVDYCQGSAVRLISDTLPRLQGSRVLAGHGALPITMCCQASSGRAPGWGSAEPRGLDQGGEHVGPVAVWAAEVLSTSSRAGARRRL